MFGHGEGEKGGRVGTLGPGGIQRAGGGHGRQDRGGGAGEADGPWHGAGGGWVWHGRLMICSQVMRRVSVFVKEVQDYVWPSVVCYLTQQVGSIG